MDMRPVDNLVSAALLGHLADVRMMVADDPALLSARNMFGAGAVHAAHYGGQGAVLDVLMDLGLVVDGFLAAGRQRPARGRHDRAARSLFQRTRPGRPGTPRCRS